jgi:uncharacterized protein (DUF433 family)
MPRKTKTVEPHRLDVIENRLRQLEAVVAEAFLSPLPPGAAAVPRQPLLTWSWLALSPKLKEKRLELRESPVAPWHYLVRHSHPWRKQLYIKGHNMTARQLVGSMKTNDLDEKTAVKNFNLPVAALREALSYVEQNRELLETEAEIERLMLKRGGAIRGPQPVSG